MAGRKRRVAGVRLLIRAAALTACVAAPVTERAWAQRQGDAPEISQAGVRDFDIAAQGLGEALIVFGRQSGLQVSVDMNVVRGLQTPGVRGRMTAQQALTALLAGTGLVYRASGSMVAVERPPSGSGVLQLDPVQVQGVFPVPPQALIDNIPPPYAGGQVATGGQLGLLGNRPVMDTPFNQTNYTAKKAEDQQAKTVRDVLLDNPSVRATSPDGGVQGDLFRIRGFVGNDGTRTYGGLYGMLPTFSPMAEVAERIEVLTGPNVLLNGMAPGGIGGNVNIVPKRAPEDALTQITASYASAGQFGAHADVARRFGADKEFGVRFNGVFKAGNTAVENNTDQRALALLGLDFRGDHVRLSADLGYQDQYIGGMIAYLGFANGVPLPWAPDARKNPAPSWNYQYRKDLFGVVRAEVDMTDQVTAYAAFGAHDNRLAGLNVSQLVATDFSGTVPVATPYIGSQYATYLTGEAGARALFATGPIAHQLGLTATTFMNENGSGYVAGPAFATNIYNPTPVARPAMVTPAAPKSSTQGLSSLGIADTLSAADKRIQLTSGLRLQNVNAQNYNALGQPTAGYDQTVVSPAVALVFKPWGNVSVYGNWIQGLQPGSVVGSQFANAGQVLSPFVSTQYEAGVKVDWGKVTTTASLFQITQPFTLTNIASNTLFLGGEQRNRGLELNVFGEPMDGVRLLGGVMFLDAVLARTQGGATDGWIAPFSPPFSLNLYGEWDLPFAPGLTLNGRAVYTSSQYIDTTWPRRALADWTRFDLGARYAFENPGAEGKLLVARFNVENVLDADYWAGGSGANATSLFVGAPRTFRLSLTADF